jgi:hypothetical protein
LSAALPGDGASGAGGFCLDINPVTPFTPSPPIVPLHQNNSAHGALGVRRLKHLRKTSAPWMHHRHHGDKRGHHCCIRCPDLPQNSPPAFNSPRFIGRKTPDQLMPNQFSAATNRFFGKWFVADGVAETSRSATLRVSQAEYVILGGTIGSSRRLANVGYCYQLPFKAMASRWRSADKPA